MGLAYLLEPSFQIVDKSGNPLSNGFIEVYISGTSTKYYCYSDFNGSLHPFRIPLDAIGSNIILASSELIYDVFIYNSFGTLVMSRHRVEPITSTTTSGYAYIFVEGTEGQIAVQSTGSTDIIYKVGLDDAIINELSGIHNDISSTSAYLDDKINNLDIHNITIEQSGNGNAYTSFTKNGDTYTFNKEATYLPSANAPVVLAGENVEVSSANVNGKMQYTVKANPAGNVTNLISTDESISISSTSVGNDVTYDLSIGSLSGKANYALCSVDDYPLMINQMTGIEFRNPETKGITWSTIDQRLVIPSTVELLDVNFECELLLSSINNVTYGNLVLGIFQDSVLLEEKTFEIDLSKERHFVNFTTKMLDVQNLQFYVTSPMHATANIRVGVNDETFKSIAGGGGSSDIELYSSDGSLLISADGSAYDLKLNEQLSAKNYFVPNITGHDFQISFGLQANEYFGWHSPRSTDLTCYRDVSGTLPWFQDDFANLRSIKIPKEMKLFELGAEFEINITPEQISAFNYGLDISIYLDDVVVCEYKAVYDMLNGRENINFNKLIYNPFDHDALMTFKSNSEFPNNWRRLCINDETYRSIGTSGQCIPDNYNSLYSTVSSNSASWNAGGGEGATYSAGPNINITNNTISGKDWSNEINAKLDTTAFTLQSSANWDNTYNTVSSNSANWNNNSPIINHNQVASGTLVVNNNEYINVSDLDVSGVLTVKAMNTSVINDEPIRQCGGTLLFNTQPSAVNFVDSNDTALPNIVLPTTFSGDKYQFTIINGVVACQEIN